ncbi:MAG: hypothetical protein RDV41_13640, partial [Planctomycetota bacterium]|nr:hypothetical protein [Planctomycetota bacterium]
GFLDFTLIPFSAPNTEISRQNPRRKLGPDLQDILKLVAVSRIFFSRAIKNVQLKWSSVGLDTSLRSLSVGVNDIGGTIYDAGLIALAPNGEHAKTPHDLEKSISRTGRVARRRDSYYNPVATKRRKASARKG